MIFTSLKFPSVVFGAVLAVSASFAVAGTIPINPLPPMPPDVAVTIPINPLPPMPPDVAVTMTVKSISA